MKSWKPATAAKFEYGADSVTVRVMAVVVGLDTGELLGLAVELLLRHPR